MGACKQLSYILGGRHADGTPTWAKSWSALWVRYTRNAGGIHIYINTCNSDAIVSQGLTLSFFFFLLLP